jgi:benzoyl-CoA reductase/2-hydroxyglutaryl-CoA dehydratase subunit BcrC/BadD/HgdB
MTTKPSRKEYILQQKEEHSRPAVAVLPVHYPKEILTALDILSVEMWGPPGSASGAGAERIQTYVCSIVRNAMSFIQAGKADVVDGIVFPHTCDSLQGLATLVADWGGWGKPVFYFQHPRGPERPEAQAYLRSELRAFAAALQEAFQRVLEPERLLKALQQHAEADRLKRELFKRRRGFAGTDLELYGLLRRGEYLWVEDHIAELKAAVEGLSEESREGIPILVSGYVPEPMGILEVLNDAGAFVVADDYAAVGRRIADPEVKPTPEGDEWELLARRYLSYPPCPTRCQDSQARISRLLRLAREAGARGLLVHEIKFCEPELFDVPMMRDAFEGQGLPVLLLETELERTVSAQTATRIEAFVEVLRGRG